MLPETTANVSALDMRSLGDGKKTSERPHESPVGMSPEGSTSPAALRASTFPAEESGGGGAVSLHLPGGRGSAGSVG